MWVITGLEGLDNSSHPPGVGSVCDGANGWTACNLRQDLFYKGLPLKRVVTLGNVSAVNRTWCVETVTVWSS
jgi:hypothetical protein